MGFFDNENGQSVFEYSLLFAVVVLVIIAAIPPLRDSILSVMNKAGQVLNNTPAP